MAIEMKTINLTDRQISHAVVALQEYIKLLNREAAEDPQGGEHEDILIADSIIRELARAKKTPGVLTPT
jgi:hypothetical protein